VAENLFVIDNSFYNVHAAFSLDGAAGRNWHFIGNQLLNTCKPGLEDQPNRGGKIFKYHTDEPFPSEGFYVLFNSVQTRTAYLKRGETREFKHKNYAIRICRSGPDCDPIRQMFGDEFAWHASYVFGDDLSDHPDFPDGLVAQCFIVSGPNAGAATFSPPCVDPSSGDPDTAWDRNLMLMESFPGHSL
jgi:hypothetical protein